MAVSPPCGREPSVGVSPPWPFTEPVWPFIFLFLFTQLFKLSGK